MKIGKKYIPVLVALSIAVVGAAAGGIIVQQGGPSIGNGTATPNCKTMTASQTQALVGTSGAILFDCSTYGFMGTSSTTQSCVTSNSCTQTAAFTIGAAG